MLRALKKYVSVYGVQVHNNFVREAVYRTNFLTSMVVDLIWIGVEFTLFTVIYQNVDTLGGWTKHQVYFFLGTLFSSDALFTILFTRNFWTFGDLVNKGELDILLTRPIHPLFLALTRSMNITAFSNFLLGLAIAVRYAEPAGFRGGVEGWLLFLFWILVGLSTALLLRFAFSVWVFWTDRAWAMSRMYYQFFGFATKPDGIYPKTVKYIVMTALPFAFIGSVPARALLHGLARWEYILVGVVLLSFLVFDLVLWNRGLRRYQSASS